MEHDNVPGPLTSEEFDAMMREMDDAQEWMIDQCQLSQRLIVQAFSPAIREIDD